MPKNLISMTHLPMKMGNQPKAMGHLTSMRQKIPV
jgi:hypothetical protein